MMFRFSMVQLACVHCTPIVDLLVELVNVIHVLCIPYL